jgi:hypothetical protein
LKVAIPCNKTFNKAHQGPQCHEADSIASRADRARLVKETINKTMSRLLTSYPRARAGVASAQLLRDLPETTSCQTPPPTVCVIDSDTLDAAQALHISYPSDRIAVLSMASPLRPGGGVLIGATSQEESLCIRSTLFPSLRHEFHRLPENALVYTSDVLVFRAQDTKE